MNLVYKDASEAWKDLYSTLKEQADDGFCQPSRAGNVVGELINVSIVIDDPTRGIVQSPIRNMDMRYALGEFLFYMSGSNKLSSISQYSSFWNKLSDDGETVNSAYGHRIFGGMGFNQWTHVQKLLQDDPFTRQAVIHIKDASQNPSKDIPCTLSLQFLIRDNQLNMNAVMRSNDIWLGFPYDVFCFTAMQVMMAMQLGIPVGDYTHFVGSLHLYEKDVNKNDTVQSTNKVKNRRSQQ